MKKNVFGRRFKRDKDARRALFKSLVSSLVLQERIKTTEAKAKAIKADAEKIVTKAKKNKDLARRTLGAILNSEALEKLLNDLAPRFVNRNGGYTRIIRIGRRFGDDAMEVALEWTEAPKAIVGTAASAKPKTKKEPKAKTPSRVKAPRAKKETKSKTKPKKK